MGRQFKLKQEEEEAEERKPGGQVSEMQFDQPAEVVSEKPAASTSAGNIFTCVSEGEESSSSGEFEYVWVNGRLEKRLKKEKGKKGKGLKCKLVPGGMRKVKAMEKKLKAIS